MTLNSQVYNLLIHESLKFDSYPDSDSDNDMPLEAAIGDDNNDENDPDNGGGYGGNTGDPTNASGGSSSQPGSDSWGADGSTSHTFQLNDNTVESSGSIFQGKGSRVEIILLI